MFKMLHITMLTKQQADSLCDAAGINRKEHSNRMGWSYTALSFRGESCGEIAPVEGGKPLTLAVDMDRVSARVRDTLLNKELVG